MGKYRRICSETLSQDVAMKSAKLLYYSASNFQHPDTLERFKGSRSNAVTCPSANDHKPVEYCSQASAYPETCHQEELAR